MMYYVNGWAFVLLLGGLLVTGDGARALSFVGKHPAILSKMMQVRPPAQTLQTLPNLANPTGSGQQILDAPDFSRLC